MKKILMIIVGFWGFINMSACGGIEFGSTKNSITENSFINLPEADESVFEMELDGCDSSGNFTYASDITLYRYPQTKDLLIVALDGKFTCVDTYEQIKNGFSSLGIKSSSNDNGDEPKDDPIPPVNTPGNDAPQKESTGTKAGTNNGLNDSKTSISSEPENPFSTPKFLGKYIDRK